MCDAALIVVNRLLDDLDVRELIALDSIDMIAMESEISLRMLIKGLAKHPVLVDLPLPERLRIEKELFNL